MPPISETPEMFTVRMSRKAVATVPVDITLFEQVALLLAVGEGEGHSVCITLCEQNIATSHFHELGYCPKANISIYCIPSTF